MEKLVKDQIKERIYNFILEGVEKFPKNEFKNLCQVPGPGKINSNEIPKVENITINSLQKCSPCIETSPPKKMIISPEISKKKFFVLSEFPEVEDETFPSPYLFSEKSSSGLIIKLVEKLGILKQCYFSFALKCIPDKGVSRGAFFHCAEQNLKEELIRVKPDIVFCFGYRALAALSKLSPKFFILDVSENTTILPFEFDNNQKQVFFLSSSRDLQAFPQWRSQVWRFLETFKTNN